MAKELKLYLPFVLQDVAEYEALSNAESPFLEDIEAKTEQIIEDSFLTTMSASRLAEWEKALGIIPTTDPISQRRSVVLSRFRGTGKLNKTLIQAMVNAFTGGTAVVAFTDGILSVKVMPPSSTFKDFSIDDVAYELIKRKPAHVLMTVELAYITWEQVSTNFTSWNDIIENFESWDELYKYYISQEGYSLWH